MTLGAAWTLWAAAPAQAARPTDFLGLFRFDRDDVIATYDDPGGHVRVHYSSSGPNVTELDDEDANGVPDYVEIAGRAGGEAFELYVATGFREPVRETDLGLQPLGGTDAFDVYLVDFGGQADGNFSVDACAGGRCTGCLIVENDFAEARYASDTEALETVVPHEMFHAVQAAYADDLESWTSEGTATWAERLYRPESRDFRNLAGLWFDEPTRSIDDPPVGPVAAFAYGTSLWFDFLTTRHDVALIVEVLEGTVDTTDPDLDVVLAALDARGDDVRDMWTTFSAWNLATGYLEGAADSYEYASNVGPPRFEQEDVPRLDDDNRFYPLATTYYHVEHNGGPVFFGLAESAPDVSFALHPVDGDGNVLPAQVEWDGADPAPRELADLPEGEYYLWGSQAISAEDSVKVRFCAGPAKFVEECFALAPTTPTTPTDTGDGGDDGRGCGCDGVGSGASAAGALIALFTVRRAGSRRKPSAA